MTAIYLIRHAQADGNLYRRCQAWYDGLITPIGYKQIEALEQRFLDTHFDAVYSSDLFRTMTTAKAIYKSHNLPLHTDPELREIGSGCWEDRPWGELLQHDRESLLAFWRCDPAWIVDGGETFGGIQKRFDRAVQKIASKHPDQTIAIFAHGCIIRSTLAYWLGLPPDQIRKIPHGDNTSVARLEYEANTVRVCWYNDTSHLSGDLAHAPHPAAKTDEETASGIERSSLYFIPMDPAHINQVYLQARADTWMHTYHTMDGFDSKRILSAAFDSYSASPNNVLTAMLNGQPAGILHLDRLSETNFGRVEFLYMNPELRNRNLGVQLIGQAVSTFRASGLKSLRLDCPQQNSAAKKFFCKFGFLEVDHETMEKYIGY